MAEEAHGNPAAEKEAKGAAAEMDDIESRITTAMRSRVPIDSCYIGSQNSAFLQQASYITGGVHHKPQNLDGLFQYLMAGDSASLTMDSSVNLQKKTFSGVETTVLGTEKEEKEMVNVAFIMGLPTMENHTWKVFGNAQDGASKFVK
ncbi:hypothetical protein GOBAR_DD32476 [Gossypium barbadense]|nr:hypothetical protein GOBAR_DD32476 [Gossypium barbadense]